MIPSCYVCLNNLLSSGTFTAHLRLKCDKCTCVFATIWCTRPIFAIQLVHTTFAIQSIYGQHFVCDSLVHATVRSSSNLTIRGSNNHNAMVILLFLKKALFHSYLFDWVDFNLIEKSIPDCSHIFRFTIPSLRIIVIKPKLTYPFNVNMQI